MRPAPPSNDRRIKLLIVLAALLIVAACTVRVVMVLREDRVVPEPPAPRLAQRPAPATQPRRNLDPTTSRLNHRVALDAAALRRVTRPLATTRRATPTSNAVAVEDDIPPELLDLLEQELAEQEAAENEPLVPLDLARVALDYVGIDPLANEVWAIAINDPRLTPQERAGLIGDLNANGFANPPNVAPDELPIVLNRISLIEQLAPDAMDQANLDAFNAVYRELTTVAQAMMTVPDDVARDDITGEPVTGDGVIGDVPR